MHLLRDDFQGTLRNLKIVRLLITEEDLQKTFPETYDPAKIQPGSVAHLLMTVEQKSSGKAPSTAAVDFLLVSRKYTDKADVIYRVNVKAEKPLDRRFPRVSVPSRWRSHELWRVIVCRNLSVLDCQAIKGARLN